MDRAASCAAVHGAANSVTEQQQFIFNWRIIALQYCIGSAIQRHESAIGIHTSPPREPPSLPSVFETGSSCVRMPARPVDRAAAHIREQCFGVGGRGNRHLSSGSTEI